MYGGVLSFSRSGNTLHLNRLIDVEKHHNLVAIRQNPSLFHAAQGNKLARAYLFLYGHATSLLNNASI